MGIVVYRIKIRQHYLIDSIYELQLPLISFLSRYTCNMYRLDAWWLPRSFSGKLLKAIREKIPHNSFGEPFVVQWPLNNMAIKRNKVDCLDNSTTSREFFSPLQPV